MTLAATDTTPARPPQEGANAGGAAPRAAPNGAARAQCAFHDKFGKECCSEELSAVLGSQRFGVTEMPVCSNCLGHMADGHRLGGTYRRQTEALAQDGRWDMYAKRGAYRRRGCHIYNDQPTGITAFTESLRKCTKQRLCCLRSGTAGTAIHSPLRRHGASIVAASERTTGERNSQLENFGVESAKVCAIGQPGGYSAQHFIQPMY